MRKFTKIAWINLNMFFLKDFFSVIHALIDEMQELTTSACVDKRPDKHVQTALFRHPRA